MCPRHTRGLMSQPGAAARAPLQNAAMVSDLRVHRVVHAARWYSLITLPGTFRRRTGGRVARRLAPHTRGLLATGPVLPPRPTSWTVRYSLRLAWAHAGRAEDRARACQPRADRGARSGAVRRARGGGDEPG